jgi:hypothetical protein
MSALQAQYSLYLLWYHSIKPLLLEQIIQMPLKTRIPQVVVKQVHRNKWVHLIHLIWLLPRHNYPMPVEVELLPILNGWAMSPYLLRLEKGGVREPHWHPNAAELSYCISGRATMTMFLGGPNLVHDTFTIDPGEIVFVPQALFTRI